MRKKSERTLKKALHKHQGGSSSRTSHRLNLFTPKMRGIPTIFLADAWLAWRAWSTVSRSRMKSFYFYSQIDTGSPRSNPITVSTDFISNTNWTATTNWTSNTNWRIISNDACWCCPKECVFLQHHPSLKTTKTIQIPILFLYNTAGFLFSQFLKKNKIFTRPSSLD